MNNDPTIELTDALAAGVFRAGLKAGVLNLTRLIEWADLQMAAQAEPATWLIDLSIAQPDQINEIVAMLRPAAAGVSNEVIAKAGFALANLPAEKSAKSAGRLLLGLTQYELHSEASADQEELNRLEEAFTSDAEGTIEAVFAFAAARQNPAVRAFFAPVVWDL